MKKNTTKFCKIPKSFVRNKGNDSAKILTYYAIDNFRLLADDTVSVVSLQEICKLTGYKANNGKYGYLPKIRSHLLKFHSLGIIELVDINVSKPIKTTNLITIKLNPDFFPTKDYVQLTDDEFNTLISIKSSIQKAYLFKVFLNVKSYIYIPQESDIGTPSAFYKSIDSSVEETGITRYIFDKCLDILVEHNLLVKHETGSYKTNSGLITNAPNIYVLNDTNVQNNINASLSRLKNTLNVSKFMPCVYNTKKIKKEKD